MKEEAVVTLFKKAEDELLLHQIQVQNLVHIQKAFDIAKQKLEEDLKKAQKQNYELEQNINQTK